MGKTQRLVSILAVLVLVVAGAAAYVLSRPSGGGKEQAGEHQEHDSLSHAMREALERNPSLAKHRLALAFVSEKLEQQGGEASGELKNGPYAGVLRPACVPAQVHRSASSRRAPTLAFVQLPQAQLDAPRARRRCAQASGVAPAAASVLGPVWARTAARSRPRRPTRALPTYVSGRTTALAISRTCTSASCTLWARHRWRWALALPQPAQRAPDLEVTSAPASRRPSHRLRSTGHPTATCYVGTGEPNGSSRLRGRCSACSARPTAGTRFSKVSTLVRAAATSLSIARSERSRSTRSNPKHFLIGTAVARHGSSSVNGGRFTPPGRAARSGSTRRTRRR